MKKFIIFIFSLLILGGCQTNSKKNLPVETGRQVVKEYRQGSGFYAIKNDECVFVTAHHVDPQGDNLGDISRDITIKQIRRSCPVVAPTIRKVWVMQGDPIILSGFPKGKRRLSAPYRVEAFVWGLSHANKKYNKKYSVGGMVVIDEPGKHGPGSSGGLACKVVVTGECVPFGVIVASDTKGRAYISPFYKDMVSAKEVTFAEWFKSLGFF